MTLSDNEIKQIIDEFLNMTTERQYIGARYVPIFGRKDEDSILWDNTAPYEPLTIVLYQGNSYTSRQYVPIGVDISNEEFWANTGNYNAQIEQYRQEVLRIGSLLPDTDFTPENTVKKYVDDVNYSRTRSFDTVTEMKNSETLQAGLICHTNGFHSIGDNGAAWYNITNEGEANEMDIIELDNGLLAVLVSNNAVNLEQLGIGSNASTNADIFNYAIANYNKINCFTDFTISKPVNISALSSDETEVRNDMELNMLCHIESTCSENYCFEINHINRFHLNFDRITSAKGIFNLTAHHDSGSGSFNTIVYLYFNSMVLNAGEGYSCINAVTTGDGWINEVYLNQTRFKSGVAITGARAQKTAPISNWHLNQVATEGVTSGIKILGDNWDIRNCRILESGSSLTTATDGFTIDNFTIFGTYIGMTRYVFTNNDNGIIYGEKFIGANLNDFTYGTHAYAIVNGKWIRVGENPVGARITSPNSSTDTYDLTLDTNVYSKPRMIEFANSAINKLIIDPAYYFGKGLYNEILISVPNLSGGSFNVNWSIGETNYTYDIKNVIDTNASNHGVLIVFSPYSPNEVAFIPIGRMIRAYNYQV